ncbi:MAG: acyl-CoA dehydrogenase, partial [Chloroflexi bacterium]|nr:acyl-CoA dehydrogenase [Chloroflexota bacterium]
SGQLTFDELLDLLRLDGQEGLPKDASPALRHRLADMAVEFQVGRLLAYRVAWLQSQGQVPNYEASTSKVFGTELTQRVGRACIEALGLYGPVQRGTRSGALDGRIASMYLANVSATIAGGTSEIQRNIIATRGLGLPR